MIHRTTVALWRAAREHTDLLQERVDGIAR